MTDEPLTYKDLEHFIVKYAQSGEERDRQRAYLAFELVIEFTRIRETKQKALNNLVHVETENGSERCTEATDA